MGTLCFLGLLPFPPAVPKGEKVTQQYESDNIPDLSEIGGYWNNRPVFLHGSGMNRTGVCLGRRIAHIPDYNWPSEPETCTAGSTDTLWILDGRVLLCTGCGIDGT